MENNFFGNADRGKEIFEQIERKIKIQQDVQSDYMEEDFSNSHRAIINNIKRNRND